MKIAILSDTHGFLRPEAMGYINNCDAIIHAGDINTQEIVNQLREKASLYIVQGNNDREWARNLPFSLQFKLGGLQFYMIHNKKDLPKDLNGIDVVVFGHSHKYFMEEKEGRLWLNPGSCGKRRFTQPITMAVLTVEDRKYQVERIDFSHQENRKPAALPAEKDMYIAVSCIMKELHKGKQVTEMAQKLQLDVEFAEHICRIIVTHPGITVEGVLSRIELGQL